MTADRRSQLVSDGLLGFAVGGDLLLFFGGELAWGLAAGDLLALDVMADVIDDLGVGERRDVTDVGDVTTLANAEVVDGIRRQVQSVKVAKGDVPRELSETEKAEIQAFGAES